MTRYGELEIALRTPSDTALNWLTHAPPGAVTGLASRAKTASLWPSSWHRRPHDLDVDVATSESSAIRQREPEGAAALAKVSPVASAPPALSAAAKAHVASVTPIKKRAMTKPNVTRRYASRHKSLGLVPGEYSRRRSADEYRVSGERGGYYRESRQWGGYYGDGGGGPYQDW